MKNHTLLKKNHFEMNYHEEESMKEFFAGFIEKIWNWGLPVIAGALIASAGSSA